MTKAKPSGVWTEKGHRWMIEDMVRGRLIDVGGLKSWQTRAGANAARRSFHHPLRADLRVVKVAVTYREL